MRSEYQRDVHNNYLVLESDRYVEETAYPVRMLMANALPLFLKCRLQNMDGKRLYYYEITSRQSLEDFFEKKKFSFEDLQMIFGNFVQLVEKMAEYLLNPDQLVLEPEFIFLDAEKKTLYFCYLPGYEKPIRDQFQALTEYVLPKLNHEDNQAVVLGYGIYRNALEDVFQLEHIKEEVYRAKMQEKEKKEEKIENIFPEERKEVLTSDPAYTRMTQAEENSILDREIVFTDTKEKKTVWISVLIYTMGCLLAAGILMLLIMAQTWGYIPKLRIEVMVGILILLIAVFSFIGYLIQRSEKKKRKSIKEKEYFTDFSSNESMNAGTESEWKKEEPLPSIQKKREYQEEYIERKTEIPHTLQRKKKVQADYGETVILSDEPIKGPATLVSRDPGVLATIYLQGELTVIGKLESAADAVVDVPTVSRLHAKVRKRGDEYYLTDLNSRNGTAVNGRMLRVDEEYLLQEEDEVDFAQARYIFLK